MDEETVIEGSRFQKRSSVTSLSLSPLSVTFQTQKIRPRFPSMWRRTGLPKIFTLSLSLKDTVSQVIRWLVTLGPRIGRCLGITLSLPHTRSKMEPSSRNTITSMSTPVTFSLCRSTPTQLRRPSVSRRSSTWNAVPLPFSLEGTGVESTRRMRPVRIISSSCLTLSLSFSRSWTKVRRQVNGLRVTFKILPILVVPQTSTSGTGRRSKTKSPQTSKIKMVLVQKVVSMVRIVTCRKNEDLSSVGV